MTKVNQWMIDPDDAVMLLIDHQSGLLQTVKDIDITALRTNTAALARAATLMKVPIIVTASAPEVPNGPLLPEIMMHAPHAVQIARQGEINAWDNQDFVRAVRGTRRKTLVMAGVWTSVCMALPAVSAHAQGFKV